MSGETTEDRIPVPEYETGQYLPTGEMSDARRGVLIEKFGPIRTYFKSRPDPHFELQRRLNQARMGMAYDVYLTRTVAYAVVVGLLCALLGLVLTGVMTGLGVLRGIESPVAVSGDSALADLFVFVAANRVFFFGATVTLFLMGLGVAVTWIVRYYYPHILVDGRRRNIDVMLPHAIVYMYALSFGGMDFVSVLDRMADAEDTYGEVAHEFDMIVRDVEVFGNDLFTAIRNARNLTASDNLENFLDDMLSVLDSGGDMTSFLHDESEKYMRRGQEEQQRFLETLAMLSEVFVVAFVAAPLFLIITLIMMTFLGSAGFRLLFGIIYLVLPLGMVGFIVLISTLSEPYRPPSHSVATETDAEATPSSAISGDPRYESLRRIRLRRRLDALRSAPLEVFERHPDLTLAFAVPVAFVYLVAVAVTVGIPTTDRFLSTPLWTTSVFVVGPFLLVATPLSIAHERRRRQKRRVSGRLPDTLDILASSNQMGVSLVDGLGLVARNVSGRFATELRRVRNDIRWNYDIRRALLSMADRMAVPQLTRTCKILAEGSRSTGNLHQVLKIAAEDTRHRDQMERAREQELQTYVAVVVIGFLVYLGTVIVIDQSFLAPVIERVGETGGDLDGLVTIGAGSVSTYNALFLHSALVQAIGTGLIIGELADSDVRSGLKYSIALVLVALLVFVLV